MGALQLTYEPKFKIVHRTGELMRSHEAKSVQLWLTVDPLAEKFPNVGSYVYCFNNPINLTDPDGMAPDPPLGFRLGIKLGFSSKGTSFNITTSAGVEHRSSHFQGVAFISASVYGGQQLGTSSMTKGLQYDLTAGAYGSIGNGTGSSHNFYTLNYNTASPFNNTFDTSLTYGQARTFNSAINSKGDGPGWQTQGLIGIRLGENFSFSSNNDAKSYGTSLIFKDKNSDAGWTGGIILNAGGIEAGYQNFSGYWPEFGAAGKEYGYKFNAENRMGTGQNGAYHESLNKAYNFLKEGNVTGGSYSDAWFQNAIHKYVSDDGTYNYNK